MNLEPSSSFKVPGSTKVASISARRWASQGYRSGRGKYDAGALLALTWEHKDPSLAIHMIYIQIPEKCDARGFLLLAKSGTSVSCLPGNIYGVVPEHIKLLKRKKIPFKKLAAKSVHLPKSTLAA